MANTEQISSVLRQPAEAGDIPGVVAAAANEGGVIFEGAFGKRDLATGTPMTTDTVVWVASMTKAVTGACAMQLVEQGKLSLDGDIARTLPELGRVQVLEGFGSDGKPRLRAPKRGITLRDLLTHTAGFAYEMWNPDILRYMETTGTPGIISCQNAALTLPLVSDPGAKWEYGISIDWAGKAVEAIAGQTLGRYMQDNLLGPLGMADTGFKIGDAQRRRLAKIHSRTPDGLVSTDTEIPQSPEFEMGGGGLMRRSATT
jgi:methyl acetate hydrolase